MRSLALVIALLALPGDPPSVPIAPADGAAVPASRDGIGVRFTCPNYRIFETGTFTQVGNWSDYGVRFATAPDLGSDGRLLDTNAVAQDISPLPSNAGPDHCTGVMKNPQIGEPGPEETPGDYYWQAYRICTGCPTGYETSAVWRFQVRTGIDLRMSVQRRAFRGYPVVAQIRADGVPDGGTVTVERRAGGRWRALKSVRVSSSQSYAVFFLPTGERRLRLSTAVGDQTGTSRVYPIDVKPPRGWSTSRRDVGRYKGKEIALKVARRGRAVRDFQATVTTFCLGPTVEDNRFLIGIAPFERAKIAPDGRFYSITRPEDRTVVEATGRIRNGRARGFVRLTIGGCDGIAEFSARLRR
jgi:hypothetical protein